MSDGQAIFQTLKFETINCCKCGIPFAVPEGIRRRWLDSGDSFWCPNGHSQHYTTSTVQKLEKQLQQEVKRREWAEQDRRNAENQAKKSEYQRRAIKGVLTKTRNRIGAGVCPCCSRTFQQLAKHMASQHPEYAQDQETSHDDQ